MSSSSHAPTPPTYFPDWLDFSCPNCLFENKGLVLLDSSEDVDSVVLPTCGHGICTRCLGIYLNKSTDEYVTIACNTCWVTSEIKQVKSTGKYIGLPREELLSTSWYSGDDGEFHVNHAYDLSPLCDNCSMNAAEHFCREDRLKFCSVCWSHMHIGDAMQHLPHSTYSKRHRTCSKHSGQPVLYRCTSHGCLRFGCALCVQSPEHQHHRHQVVDHLYTHMRIQITRYYDVAHSLFKVLKQQCDDHNVIAERRESVQRKRLADMKTYYTGLMRKDGANVKHLLEVYKSCRSTCEQQFSGHTIFRRSRYRSLQLFTTLFNFYYEAGKTMDLLQTEEEENGVEEVMYRFISRAHPLLVQMFPGRMRVFSDTYMPLPCTAVSDDLFEGHACHTIAYLRNDVYYVIRPAVQDAIVCSTSPPIQLKFKCHYVKKDQRFYLAIASSAQCVLDMAVCQLSSAGKTSSSIYEEAGFFVSLTEEIPMALLPIFLGDDVHFDAKNVEVHFRVASHPHEK